MPIWKSDHFINMHAVHKCIWDPVLAQDKKRLFKTNWLHMDYWHQLTVN